VRAVRQQEPAKSPGGKGRLQVRKATNSWGEGGPVTGRPGNKPIREKGERLENLLSLLRKMLKEKVR